MTAVKASVEGEAPCFDDQALRFDQRAGVPAEAVNQILDVIETVTSKTQGRLFVDIGAGTGSLELHRLASRLYLGLELSTAMLSEHRRRLAPRRELLIRGDGRVGWPIATGAAAAVFFSRIGHLLDPKHMAAEASRVIHPNGGFVLLGGVERPNHSIASALRRRLHELMAEHDLKARSRRRSQSAFENALSPVDFIKQDEIVAAQWRSRRSPADSLKAWRCKEGLAGLAVSASLKKQILQDLESWARTRFGDLRRTHEGTLHYTLTPYRLRGNRRLLAGG